MEENRRRRKRRRCGVRTWKGQQSDLERKKERRGRLEDDG